MTAGRPRNESAWLEDIERVRDELASRVAPLLAERVIDAIVFVRFAENRRLLASGGLQDLRRCLTEANDAFRGWLLGRSGPAALDAELRCLDGLDEGLIREIVERLDVHQLGSRSIETLGHLYEHGLDRAHRRAKKSGGVYYTPEHVVRYMVAGTLGSLLDGLTLAEAATLRVLDPACGAGSFLLGAFELLIDWHTAWYASHDPEEHAKGPRPTLFRDQQGAWRLTAAKRVEILLGSIFGVDLDERALEWTRLSLSLRALSGVLDEKEANPRAALDVLGGLDANVRAGDSLVDTEFDYRRSFASVFAQGGFDVVVGNPPYVSYGGRQAVQIPAARRRYFATHYESGGWATAHSLFMERAAKDLSRRLVSFIVPDQVGHLGGYASLRALMSAQGSITEVKYWGENVFKGVVTPSLTFVLDRGGGADEARVLDVDGTEHRLSLEGGRPWSQSSSQSLLDKLQRGSTSIRAYLADCGVRTTDAKKQVVRIDDAHGAFMPVLEGKQIRRYSCAPPEVAVRLDAGPRAFVSRAEKYAKAEFLIRQTAAYPIVGPREHATYFRNSLHALYPPDNGWDVRYVVGLLNSKLLRFAYVANVREAGQRAFPQVKLGPLGSLPIRDLDVQVREQKEQHDRVVALVASLLALKAGGKAAAEAAARANELDARLDAEVFRIYGLTDDEIATVETTVAALATPP